MYTSDIRLSYIFEGIWGLIKVIMEFLELKMRWSHLWDISEGRPFDDGSGLGNVA